MDKQLITHAFEKLGPEKVKAGLAAKYPQSKRTFHGCFLALCYGDAGALMAMAHRLKGQGYAKCLGISQEEMEAVYIAFDDSPTHDAFCALAEEWLELNRMPCVRASQQAPA